MDEWLKHYKVSTDVEQETDNIKIMLRKTAEELLGKIRVTDG